MTDTADAPWPMVKSVDRKGARRNCPRHFLCALDYHDRDRGTAGTPDPFFVTSSDHAIRNGERIPGKSPHPQHRHPAK